MSTKVMAVICANGNAHIGKDDKPWTGTDFQELLKWAENLETDCGPHSVADLGSFGRSRCPCTLAEPCRDMCSCANSVMSGGCYRCASYGSAEQRQGVADWIVKREKVAEALARKVLDVPMRAVENPYGADHYECPQCEASHSGKGSVFGGGWVPDGPMVHDDDCPRRLAEELLGESE